MTRWAILFALVSTAGCTQFPQLDRATSDAARAAPYPDLVPLSPLLSREGGTSARSTPYAARLAALRARAAKLRANQVITDETRERMTDSAG